ncbi:hypothetical protein VN97_g1957 [Penicillium thymicola]|uniref:Uncharacterized protein n=1 Tax=Penicillium thymicola TaxID=293382 RepID=A0AAI9XBK4_PENTH|nr:hypothetical protein VN97_g1957 [Penicillium thymicola]
MPSQHPPSYPKLGYPLPDKDPYGISVYLPTWRDTLGWASRDPVVLAQLKTGYPRFFIPHVVRELASRLLQKANPLSSDARIVQSEVSALLIASHRSALECQTYLQRCGSTESVVLHATLAGSIEMVSQSQTLTKDSVGYDELYLITHPEDLALEAKAFWQHTGSGISSRCAVYWLEYNSAMRREIPMKEAVKAMSILHDRIASLFSTDSIKVAPSDVILYPTGMSAISQSAKAIQDWRGRNDIRVAVFGFLYVDTFKVLSRIHAIDCVLYGHTSSQNLTTLENDLENGMKIDALYTEFPGNPLLNSPDLDYLHQLSTRYGFLLVVDDTVGTAVNLSLFPSCDVICTSLTKMFSGGCNVMGGSTALNLKSPWYNEIRQAFSQQPNEPYFPLDVLVMEQNSRDIANRVRKASSNAENLVNILRSHQTVSEVFYPKGIASQSVYDRFKRPDAGYGCSGGSSSRIIFNNMNDIVGFLSLIVT